MKILYLKKLFSIIYLFIYFIIYYDYKKKKTLKKVKYQKSKTKKLYL
jgi:hypothetical protein